MQNKFSEEIGENGVKNSETETKPQQCIRSEERNGKKN